MDWKSIMSDLTSGSIPKTSELNLMNEHRQEKVKGASVNKLRYQWKKKSRVLVSLQLAIPFNPETGMPDESFNANTKWRPAISVSTAARIIKDYCQKSDAAKQEFMRRAGVAEWDVSDPDVLTDVDFKVLRKYRVPITPTVDTVQITDQAVTGQTFPIKYSVKVEYDYATGEMLGEIPKIVKMGEFYTAVIFNEINELTAAIREKDSTLYKGSNPNISAAAIPSATEKQFKEWKKSIFSTAIITSVQPSNYYIGYEFPLSQTNTMLEKGQPLPDYTTLSTDELKKHEIYFDASGKYKNYISLVLENESSDHHWDIIEFDLIDSQASEPKTDDEKARASADLMPSFPSNAFFDAEKDALRAPWVSELLTAIGNIRDNDRDFERKMLVLLARRVKYVDDVITSAVADAIASKLPLDSHYINDRIKTGYKDVLADIYGEEFLLSIMSDPALIETSLMESGEPVANAAELLSEFAESVSDDINVEEIDLED